MTTASLVIPGRNCEATLPACLAAVADTLRRPGSPLREIVFVDDGSTDGTARIAERFPVTIARADGRGPAAARNVGWRAACAPLVWFVDADCVAASDALDRLLPHLDDERVAAVSGTYGNANAHSLLACLIHEEIVQRHLAMPTEVDFLATFNVLYRRAVLEELGGFDERYLKAQDAELSFRAREAGYHLHFERGSRVDHYHEQRWLPYLRTQRRQGYWRVWLHLEHPGRGRRNSYSRALDHAQPFLALALIASLPCAALPAARWAPLAALGLLLASSLPMTGRLLRRLRRPRYLAFVPMSTVRAAWRGVGMVHGAMRYAWTGGRA